MVYKKRFATLEEEQSYKEVNPRSTYKRIKYPKPWDVEKKDEKTNWELFLESVAELEKNRLFLNQ